MTELASSLSKSPSAAHPGPTALPAVQSPLSGIEVVKRLDEAARRGRLPGFSRGPGDGHFQLADFGAPFESILHARTVLSGSGCEVRFHTRLKPLAPWIFFAVLVLTVWPGVWLTDSMLKTYFDGYGAKPDSIPTWWWYVPLTIICIPLSMYPALKRSRASAHKEALSLIEKIGSLVGASARAGKP